MSLNVAATVYLGASLMGTFSQSAQRAQGLIKRIGESVEGLRKRQKELGETEKRYAQENDKTSQRRLKETRAEIDLINRRIEVLGREQNAVKKIGEAYTAGKDRAKKSYGQMQAIRYMAERITAKPLGAAIEHESGMLGVVKQMDGLRDEKTGKLTDKYYQAEDAVWRMSEELPIAVGEIRGMLESAGQMGIKDIEKAEPFVLSVGKTAIALELDRKQAASDMAKLATIFQIPVQDIEHRIGDAINKLADNSTATGAQIINILKRIGGNAKFANMSEHDSAALSAFMMSVSTSEEVAATAANALIRELSVAEMQPTRFKDGLKTLGLDAKKLQQDMAQKPTETILEVLKKLNAAKPEERATISTQLFGKEYGDDVAKAAIGIDTFESYLGIANSAEARGSIQREFDAKRDSMEYKLQRMNNQLERLNANVGQAMIGPVGDLVELLGTAGKALASFAKAHPIVLKTLLFIGASVTLGAVLMKIGTIVTGVVQAMAAAVRFLLKVAGFEISKAKGFKWLEEDLLPPEERNRRRFERWGKRRSGWQKGRLGNAMNRGSWGRGASRLGGSGLKMLSSAWRSAGAAARWAGRRMGATFRLLRYGIRGVLTALGANPFGLALMLLGEAIRLVYERWDSFKWFFGEISAKMEDFKNWLIDLKNSASAAIEKVGELLGYQEARTWTSDAIESVANWWQGKERVRADAPVMTRRDLESMVPPPPPPDLQSLARQMGAISNDHSTTTINITQQPGESADLLARRVAQEQERARAARQRGVMYDTVPVF